MTILFTNNAASTLASDINNVATTLTVATGQGALFPSPSGASFFYVTLENTAATIREIVKVTARSSDTFTIVRGQDGTAATSWVTGDKVQLRITAADLNNFGQLDTANTWASGQVFVAPVLGTPSSGTLTNCTGYTYANLTGTVPTWDQSTTGSAGSVANALTAGTGISFSSGTTYNGSAAITINLPQAISTTSSVQFGSLGVGTAASGTTGEIRAFNNVTAYYSSDRRLKENIKDVDNALDKVCAIGSKTFDWTHEYIESKGGEDGYFVQKSDFGVVAQDVQEVFPQAVRTREDGTLAVDYEKLATLAFGAIKELVKRVEVLEAK